MSQHTNAIHRHKDETMTNGKKSFGDLLKESMKSEDTEEWIDVYFTRPIGLVFALFWNKLGVHPNVITILSIVLGIAAGVMFYFTDFWHNVAGVVLLMLANFCDSTDGQMARLTGKKTLIGRMLDGFAGDVWFFAVYAALCLRLMPQNIPFTHVRWGLWIWLLAALTGLVFHSRQAALADYYRQIHLFFLKGREGSELDNYRQQREVYEEKKRQGSLTGRMFYYNYANYCKGQEKQTPAFQRFYKAYQQRYDGVEQAPEELRERFLEGSRPLMKYTNILSFNVRAICLYTTCLLNCPWVYFIFELIVLTALYLYMRHRHEHLSTQMLLMMENNKEGMSLRDAVICAKGMIFDYGGTLDTGGYHWGRMMFHAYERAAIPVEWDDFAQAYIHAERFLATHRVIMPSYTFPETLQEKVRLQVEWLSDNGKWKVTEEERLKAVNVLVGDLCERVERQMQESREVIMQLKKSRPMVMVTNFYGNMHAVLQDYRLTEVFDHVVESAEVGVRKPDPEIFAMGLRKMGLQPGDVMVVGDSYDKDIVPAHRLGCVTVWLKGESWEENGEEHPLEADYVITHLSQLCTKE